MPHYYFHVWSGGQLAADDSGCALPSLDAARRKAEEVASHMVVQNPCGAGHWSGWDVEVTDHAGRTVLLLPISDVGLSTTSKRAA
jgi:hypothetical protein